MNLSTKLLIFTMNLFLGFELWPSDPNIGLTILQKGDELVLISQMQPIEQCQKSTSNFGCSNLLYIGKHNLSSLVSAQQLQNSTCILKDIHDSEVFMQMDQITEIVLCDSVIHGDITFHRMGPKKIQLINTIVTGSIIFSGGYENRVQIVGGQNVKTPIINGTGYRSF